MRRFVLIAVSCMLMLLVVACGAAPAAAPTSPTEAAAPTIAPTGPTVASSPAQGGADVLSFTDATGTTVNLPTQPSRIACLTEICTDILAEIGMTPVAVNDPLAEDPRFFGTDGAAIPRIGGSFFEPSLEDVAAVQPDLVIGLGGVHEAIRDGLASIAPLYIMNPRTYADSLSYLADVGRLTGREAAAQAAAEAFQEKLARYRAESPKDRSALIMWGSDVNFGIDTAGSLVGGLLAEVTDYPWPAPPVGSEGHASGGTPFSLEQVLTIDPDVLFIQTISFGPTPSTPLTEQLAANPLWSELQAVRNGDVHEVSFSLWSTGRGTRSLGLVLDEAMALLYPESFAASATGATGPISVEDRSGATITLAAPATRVACATTGCIEMLYVLGLEPVAVTNAEIAALPELYGERAASFPVIGGTFAEPSLEDIVAARPDLVLGWANDQPGLRDGLGNIPVFYVNTLTIDDAIAELRSVGALTGRTSEAETAIARFQERLAAYQAQIDSRRSAAAISGGDVNFEVLTDQSLPGSLLAQIADYPFPLPAQAQHYGGFLVYSMEELLAKDPQVLLMITPSWANATEPLSTQLSQSPLWAELRAVRDGQTYDVSPNWGSFGNLRGLELILDEAATTIYPDIFPEPLP